MDAGPGDSQGPPRGVGGFDADRATGGQRGHSRGGKPASPRRIESPIHRTRVPGTTGRAMQTEGILAGVRTITHLAVYFDELK